ncbi:ceramide synthase 5 isoform X1 [Trachypithecus francoisi]|uniref:ceramide synthase 5 isoform X1 n=1 Tax=Trachypithecus francoisi TaxID=54180 RepID=UPI00141B6E93|nr:ceramide synthase 5 isoform X1 [Trachypithecus francoisi]
MGGEEARLRRGGGRIRGGDQKGPEGGGRWSGPALGPPPRGFRWLWRQLTLVAAVARGGRKMATAAQGPLSLLWGWLWSERFWLPQNVSWADLEGPADGYGYPRGRHILSVFPLAAGIFFVRLLFERFIAKPCALHIGIEDSGPYQAQPNAILEKVFVSITKYPDKKRLEGLSKQLDWNVRKIQCWFRHRRNQDKPPTLTKFCESMWRFTFYLCIFCYGIRFLWSSPWFWDIRQCWHNYPFQPLSSGLYYYYIMELAFYWSLMFSQFTDIKRKDFLIMFVHHLVTIGLISFSYINNMVRAGTLIMCLHDVSDFLLEAAKLANYAKYQRLCDTLFVIFSAVFMVTRLGIYPFCFSVLFYSIFANRTQEPYCPAFTLACADLLWTLIGPLLPHTVFLARSDPDSEYPTRLASGFFDSSLRNSPNFMPKILNTTLFESWEIIGPYASWWLLNGLLLTLQVLHVIWSYLIARIALKALIRGKVSKDDRSDVESSSEEEDVTTCTKSPCDSSSSNGANRVNGHMGGSYWAEE